MIIVLFQIKKNINSYNIISLNSLPPGLLQSQKNKKLVVNARLGFGLLNGWNKDLGAPPFERFYLGGSGLSGFNLDGREIIALRGYDEQTISTSTGDRLISKYTLELGYPVSLNPSATVYLLSFLEGGNSWNDYKKYNPFQVKRSAGFGVRIFLPMFGLLGLDYGFGFDPLDPGAQGEVNHNSQPSKGLPWSVPFHNWHEYWRTITYVFKVCHIISIGKFALLKK